MKIDSVDTTQIQLSWDPLVINDEEGNLLAIEYRVTKIKEGELPIEIEMGGDTTLVDGQSEPLTPNTTYTYQVQGVFQEFVTLLSNPVSTPTRAVEPGDYTSLLITDSTIEIDWDANGNPEDQTQYRLRVTDMEPAESDPLFFDVTSSSALLNGLNPNTRYDISAWPSM